MIRFILTPVLLLLISTVHAQPRLVGACAEGGHQFGTIMQYVAGDTVLSNVYKLPGTDGDGPRYTSCLEVNNKIYGITEQGGAYNLGIIYEYDYNSGTYSKKFDLDGVSGAYPTGALVIGNNGLLYGVTRSDAVNSAGVIFEYDYINNIYVMKKQFGGVLGKAPTSSMLLASNNKFYGMTGSGGNNNKGVIYEYDYINDVYSKKYDFSNATGSYPYGSLVEAPNGKLYGMTTFGGLNDMGSIFEYDISSNTFLKKLDLDSANGSYPYGSLMIASNGKMYAMTSEGSIGNGGVLFEYDYVTNNYTKKIDFGPNGNPEGSLIEISNGLLYGMTSHGGLSTYGNIFEYDISTNILTEKFSFNYTSGKWPYGSLIEASNGKLYGSTWSGDLLFYHGVFFEYDITNNLYNKLAEFGKTDAKHPTGAPIQAPNGKFYGVTRYGGVSGHGVIFEYEYLSNTYTKKLDIANGPWGELLLANNGKFYGAGGDSIFEYDYINNTHTNKAGFVNSMGVRPNSGMIEASNGKFYGMTYYGGTSNNGIIFEFDPTTNLITQKFDFDSTDGFWPDAGLIEASNGKLYGLTAYGGSMYNPGVSYGNGVLFEYDYNSNTYTKKLDLTDSTGFRPFGSLIEAANGKLYGTTSEGGSNGKGVIFEFNPATNIYTRKISLTSINGYHPVGTLFEASNGKLYGMASAGGLNWGAIFEYDYVANSYTKMMDLEPPATGMYPQKTFSEYHCFPPQVLASGPTSFCLGGSVTLIANVESGNIIQWYRNTIIIPGATDDSLLVTIAGTYTVTITNALCPTLTSSPIRVRITCIPPFDEEEKISGSNSTTANFNFEAYYESATENINISATSLNGMNYTIVVIDQSGKIILNEKGTINNNELKTELDFQSYSQGVYIVRFTTERERSVEKVMK